LALLRERGGEPIELASELEYGESAGAKRGEHIAIATISASRWKE